MAPKTKFLTNNALTRKRWAKDLFKIILPAVEFDSLTGKDDGSIIQIRTELGKGEGDEVTFGIRLPLSGQGVVGDRTVEGNEEKLQFKNFKMTIEELNHAVDTGGRMEEQRVPYDLMANAKSGLQEWWVDKLSDLAVNTLAGNSEYSFCGCAMGSSTTAFANAITEPDSDHFIKVNDVAEASMTSADTIDLTFLDRLKQKAENPATGCYKVRPLMIKGKKYYRVMLHNFVFDMLRQNTNVAQWGDLLRNAGKLQQQQVEIEYNGMLISKTERLPCMVEGTNYATNGEGVYRSVLLGAQAACWAWGGAGESKSSVMAFVPYLKDAKRFVNVRGGGIFGIEKTRFDSKDYGIITGSSWGSRIS
jgi:N4-gp56 family major capsid protein